ncbi:MAG: PQQ-binding-like beta-propeller repeat protein, partial [Planctomycetia bacterium]
CGHDGVERWRRSFSEEFGRFQNKFGLAASPAQTDDAVYFLIDDAGPSYLIALNKNDGKTRWKTSRASRQSWSSPAVVEVAGEKQLACSSEGSVDGYDLKTGGLLWTLGGLGGNTAATPIPFGDGCFLVAASPGRGGERTAEARETNFALKIEKTDAGFTPRVLWKTTKATSSFSSPIVFKDCAYWVNSVGVVFCLNAATGDVLYSERLKQTCWATPLGVGDRVYFFGKDGLTTVLAAGPTYRVVAENALWKKEEAAAPPPAAAEKEATPERRRAAGNFSGPIQYGYAVVDDGLVLRTGSELYLVNPKR